MQRLFYRGCLFLFMLPQIMYAAPDNVQLAVWANEAIVATYTYDASHYLLRQRDIATYFTAGGWTAYSSALQASGLPDSVKKNNYSVSAVALLPPTVTALPNNHWQATMPLLVLYKNLQFQQKQTLAVTIDFSTAPTGEGVRGLAITRLQSKVQSPVCECVPVQ